MSDAKWCANCGKRIVATTTWPRHDWVHDLTGRPRCEGLFATPRSEIVVNVQAPEPVERIVPVPVESSMWAGRYR